MESSSRSRCYSFAVIVANDEESLRIVNRFNYHAGEHPKDKYHRLDQYPIRCNGHIGIVTYIPGYTSNAVSALYEELSSIVRGPTFMIVTAVSCKCVEVGLNELISIDTLYGISEENPEENLKVELTLYRPEGTKKTLPATAVSRCPGKPHSALSTLQNLSASVGELEHSCFLLETSH